MDVDVDIPKAGSINGEQATMDKMLYGQGLVYGWEVACDFDF